MHVKILITFLTLSVILRVSDCFEAGSAYVELPKCEACERLVDSFMKGIQRTEKENHAGGNTAWEETQLGSYANSEVRFIEIQESLCQDNRTTMTQCQTLAEELEDHLEQWWVKDRFEVPDLRHYLCVKKVRYCNHKLTGYTPPQARHDVVCRTGYELASSGVCKDVNECWEGPCEAGEFCANTEGSYSCHRCHEDCLECFGPGQYGCKVYKRLLDGFFASMATLKHLSAIGPTFMFAYAFIVLCANLVFKVPLMPSVFLLCLVICVAINVFLKEVSSSGPGE